jgi:exopolyphosphatase/guanosine-5'-triphosphate,3'-diphosphate pyrophosphatase
MIADKFKSKEIFVANVNLRDGLIKEIAQGVAWNESVQSQIVRTATRLGKRYDFDQQHANQVAFLACRLFDQLKAVHGIEDRHQIILHLAGLLHEIGIYVNNRSYHKHSMYLIRNSEFFGVSSNDLLLISLVARYHRRAMPMPTHEDYSVLSRSDRILVAKLASILRIAVALDSTRQQRIQAFECIATAKEVQIVVEKIGELAIEAAELQNGSAMFEQLFGARVSLVGKSDE